MPLKAEWRQLLILKSCLHPLDSKWFCVRSMPIWTGRLQFNKCSEQGGEVTELLWGSYQDLTVPVGSPTVLLWGCEALFWPRLWKHFSGPDRPMSGKATAQRTVNWKLVPVSHSLRPGLIRSMPGHQQEESHQPCWFLCQLWISGKQNASTFQKGCPLKTHFQLLSYCNNPAATDLLPVLSVIPLQPPPPSLLIRGMSVLPCMVHTCTSILTWHKIKTTIVQCCLTQRSPGCTILTALPVLHSSAT